MKHPKINIKPSTLEERGERVMDIADVVMLTGFAKSKNEARRFVDQKCLRINDVLVEDRRAQLFQTTLENGQVVTILSEFDEQLVRVINPSGVVVIQDKRVDHG
jgi:tyrosyl-tRNA synthetase